MIGRILKGLRREGVAFFIVRFVLVLQRLAGYRAMIFFRIPVVHYSAATDPAVEEYQPGGAGDNEMPWSPENISVRLGEGHRIFVLRVNDRPVSFAWVTESMTFAINELDACVTIDRPMVWIWNCVTLDAFRGRGYYTRLLLALIARFDVERTTIYCQPNNYASIRGIQRAGFVPWMSVAATRWGIRIKRDGDFPGTFQVMRRVP